MPYRLALTGFGLIVIFAALVRSNTKIPAKQDTNYRVAARVFAAKLSETRSFSQT